MELTPNTPAPQEPTAVHTTRRRRAVVDTSGQAIMPQPETDWKKKAKFSEARVTELEAELIAERQSNAALQAQIAEGQQRFRTLSTYYAAALVQVESGLDNMKNNVRLLAFKGDGF